MIYVPIKHLREGMTVGRSVSADFSVIPLVVAKQKMTNEIIAKLKVRQINGVYIESKFCDDLETESFLPQEFKEELQGELKGIFGDYMKKNQLDVSVGQNIMEMTDKLMSFVLEQDNCLLNVIEIKDYDNYTYSHSIYVGTLATLIGIQMKLPKKALSELAMAGLLHDIGKLEVPIKIVNKPAVLSDEEFDEMKKHPDYAVEKLKFTPRIPPAVLLGIASHHEKYNGTGYPKGLSGESIPLYGRILALADVYDALTSVRSYRRAWLPHEAIEYMMGNASTHFDFNILEAFLKTVAAYPTGSIVQLSNDSVGVVIKANPDFILRPVVRIISPDKDNGKEIDLSSDHSYLSVTITGTISDATTLPEGLFK